MGRFNDPYSRHIPETVMMVRQRGIRGEAVGIGVVLKRKWRLGEFRRSLRSLFFASRNSLEKPNSLTSDPLILPEVSSISRKGGHILSGLLNCIRRKNAETLCTRPGEQHISKGPHVFEHLKVSLHTSMPFIFAATCQHIKVLGNSNSGWNVRTIRLLSIAFGFLQICRKISPIICPIEITAVQAEGPSDLSGVEIGDQLFLIDGKDINNLSLKTINDLLCDGDVGDVVKVGIIRSISDSLTMPISADGNNNKLRTNVGNNDRYHDSGGREVSNTDSTNPASHDGHSRDVGYCVMESKLSERVDIDKKVDTGKMIISLDIVRDNIFSSKVSSFILSPPSYSTKKGMIFDNIALKGDIVASAGEIIGGTEPSYGSIGYISIGEFTQRTLVEVEGAIDDLRNQLRILCSTQNRDSGVGEGVCHAPVSSSHDSGLSSGSIGSESNFYHDTLDALVIDLRGNLGGTLPSALDAASLFLPKGQVLLQMKSIASKEVPNIDESSNLSQNAHSHTKNKVPRNFLPKFLFKPFKFSRGERPERYYSTSENADIKTPLLLLVDSQTASASEIFVAALMDNNRATCMGCKTVGKNIAQVRDYGHFFKCVTFCNLISHHCGDTCSHLNNLLVL